MITKDIAQVAISIAQELDARQIYLEAIPGTPLAALVQSSCIGEYAQAINPKEYLPDPTYIQVQSEGFLKEAGDATESMHTQQLHDFKTDMAKAVASHLNFAKNITKPVIIELVEALEKDFASIPVNVEANYEVVQVEMPAPMQNASFTELVEEFSGEAYMAITDYIGLGDRTAQEIVEGLMMTGSAEVDKAILTWAAKLGDSFFVKVWNGVFTSNASNDRFSSLIQDSNTGLDAAIVIFLCAKKLFDAPPEGTAISLVKYNTLMSEFRNQAAVRIGYGYEDFNRNKKLQIVILKSTATQVYVNAEVYQEWLTQGGNNASLFGSVMSSRPGKTIMEINERKDEFLRAWQQNSQMLTVAASNRRFVTYKDLVKCRTESVVTANLQECFGEFCNGTPVTLSTPAYLQFKVNLDKQLDDIVDADFKNLWLLCMKIVCRSVFYYTDSEKILSGIEAAVAANPRIEIREAVALSTFTYLTDYICNQIAIKTV